MFNKLERNVRLIYTLGFFYSFLIIAPVIVPFFMSKGLSLGEIFYLQAIYAGTIVLLEAPSGYFADLFGRRSALLIGSAMHGLGFFLLNFATDFAGLIVFEIAVGVASSLLSGADLALLYDSQKALEDEEVAPHSRGIANLGFLRSGAEGLGALLGGLLAMYSFEAMVIVQSLFAWTCLGIAIFLIEPPPREGAEKPDVRVATILRHLFRGDKVLRKVFIAIPAYNLATFHVVWLVQPYWESQGLTLGLFGILWFAQSLVVAVASKCGFAIEKKRGAVFALSVIGALPVLGYFGMAMLDGWFGIALCSLLFFCRGLGQVILLNALNRRVPGEFRATANSLTSFVFRLGFIATGPLIGQVAEVQGLPAAFNTLGVISVALFLLVMMPLIRSVRPVRV